MKHVVVLLLICCIAHQAVEAQVLPRGLSEQEKRMLDEGFFRPAFNVPGEFHSTRSPVDPPRAIAEWEEMQEAKEAQQQAMQLAAAAEPAAFPRRPARKRRRRNHIP